MLLIDGNRIEDGNANKGSRVGVGVGAWYWGKEIFLWGPTQKSLVRMNWIILEYLLTTHNAEVSNTTHNLMDTGTEHARYLAGCFLSMIFDEHFDHRTSYVLLPISTSYYTSAKLPDHPCPASVWIQHEGHSVWWCRSGAFRLCEYSWNHTNGSYQWKSLHPECRLLAFRTFTYLPPFNI